MKKFKFETELVLDIEDVKCPIDLSEVEVNEAITNYVGVTLVLNAKAKEPDFDTNKWFSDFNEASMNFLYAVLGKSNVEKIFDNKVIDNCDLSGLCAYVLDGITDFKKEKYQRYV